MNRMLIALLTAMLLSACSGATEEPVGNVDAEGCEHLNDGPAEAVTASATSANAPSVSTEHVRFDVTLVDVTGGKGGDVAYASAHELDHTIFLNDEVPVKVLDGAGAEVAFESTSSSSTACTTIKGRHTVPLKIGTFTLRFGPTTKTSVGLVIEPAAHAHQH